MSSEQPSRTLNSFIVVVGIAAILGVGIIFLRVAEGFPRSDQRWEFHVRVLFETEKGLSDQCSQQIMKALLRFFH